MRRRVSDVIARAALVLAVVLPLAACNTTRWDWDEIRANPREFFNITPPTLVTDAFVEGKEVRLQRWQALVVRLDEDATTGERWEMEPFFSSTVIAPVQHDFIARPGIPPTDPAGPGDAVFRLRGVNPGTQTVVFALKRPFESTASRTIRFDVVVR